MEFRTFNYLLHTVYVIYRDGVEVACFPLQCDRDDHIRDGEDAGCRRSTDIDRSNWVNELNAMPEMF
jgi:hypothetical protein